MGYNVAGKKWQENDTVEHSRLITIVKIERSGAEKYRPLEKSAIRRKIYEPRRYTQTGRRFLRSLCVTPINDKVARRRERFDFLDRRARDIRRVGQILFD